MLHIVDFRDHDHRKVKDDPYRYWRFLISDNVRCAKSCNRLRHSQMMQAFKKYGLKIREIDLYQKQLPNGLQEQLLPRFQSIPKKDLKILMATYLLQKR